MIMYMLKNINLTKFYQDRERESKKNTSQETILIDIMEFKSIKIALVRGKEGLTQHGISGGDSHSKHYGRN